MSSVLQNGLALLRAPAIELGFAMRSLLRWSRGAPSSAAIAAPLFAWATAEQRLALQSRADQLLQQFDLTPCTSRAPVDARCRNLARLDQLESLSKGLAIPVGPDGVVRAADFGCGDFHYAVALQQWLSRHEASPVGVGIDAMAAPSEPRPVVLRGLELDGYGIYRDGHSRADHARAWAAAASVAESVVQFEVADASHARLPEQDVVSLFFPFLTAYACLTWGAPLSRLRPRQLLTRAVQSLRPGGWLIVANQTPLEHQLLVRHLTGLPVVRITRTCFATELVEDSARTQDQIGSLWQRQV